MSSDGVGGLPRVSVAVTAVAVVTLAALVWPAPAPLGVVVAGGLLLAVGLSRRREAWLALGGSAVLAGVVLAGLDPAVLSWTSARYAVRLAGQVGRAGETRRVELVHVVSTVTVLAIGGGTAYLVARSVSGGQSPLVLVLLLVAAVAFTVALRE